MISEQNRRIVIATLTSFTLSLAVSAWADGFPGGVRDALGPRFNAGPRPPVLARRAHETGVDSVRYWNEIAINASGLDHTPVAAGENRVFGEQLGPGRSSRAMAIVHIAIFEAVNAIVGAEDTIDAMDLRGFGTGQRTWIRHLAFDRYDRIVLVVFVGLLLAATIAGFTTASSRPWTPPFLIELAGQ